MLICWICTDVYVVKQNPDRNGYLFCLLNILPVSHWYPFHPAAQPPSHRPVTWLQKTLFKQCPIHRCVQFTPYQPPSHTFKINTVRFLGTIHLQDIIYHSFSNIIYTVNKLTHITNSPCPSRLAFKTIPVLYVTRVVSTVVGAEHITVDAINLMHCTTFFVN